MAKIRVKNDLASSAALGVSSTGKLIRAKDFLDCFRQKPNDLYLMQKFSLSPKKLAKAYQALIERGWLTELEYHYLRGIPPIVSEGRTVRANHVEEGAKRRNSEIRGVGPQCEKIRQPLMNLQESVSLFADEVLRQGQDGPDRRLGSRFPADKFASCETP